MKEEEQLPAQTRHSAVRTDPTQFKEHVCFIDLNTSATHEHSSAGSAVREGTPRDHCCVSRRIQIKHSSGFVKQ